MVKDPVCGMECDEKTAAPSPNTKVRHTISAHLAVRKPSMPTLRNIQEAEDMRPATKCNRFF